MFKKYFGIVCLILAIIIIAVAPSWFSTETPNWLEKCQLFGNLNFLKTGAIGDTIGGITAPFVGVLSIILLFLTLKSQQQQIQEQNEKDNLNLLCEQVVKGIENFTFKEETEKEEIDKKEIEYKGSEAISKFLCNLYCNQSHLNQDKLESNFRCCEFLSVLNLCKSAIDSLEKSKLKDKSAYNQIITHQFKYRIYPEIKKNSEQELTKHFCKECNCFHGFTEEMADKIKYLEDKIIKDKKNYN